MGHYSSEVKANLERAETNLQVSRELFDKGYDDVAASRAYYAAFYAASALLLNQGIDTSKHSDVIALIHQNFVKEHRLTKEQGKNLNWLFELRNVGDYGITMHVPSAEAQRAVEIAESFFKAAKVILDS